MSASTLNTQKKDLPNKMLNKAIELSNKPEYRELLANEAENYYNTYLDFKMITARLRDIYQKIADHKKINP